MQKHPVCYYYKCPTTAVEMKFTMESSFGWGVSFPKSFGEYEKLLEADIEIPWPTLSAEEQAVVDENYKKLHSVMNTNEEKSREISERGRKVIMDKYSTKKDETDAELDALIGRNISDLYEE